MRLPHTPASPLPRLRGQPQALELDSDNFYLLGNSWGSLLGIEYALKCQQNLKGLIISNMMASIPAYNEYAQNVLMPQLDPAVLAEIMEYETAGDYPDMHLQPSCARHAQSIDSIHTRGMYN